jgi:FG-GAP-like repeat
MPFKIIAGVILCLSLVAGCSAPQSDEPHFAVGRAPGWVAIAIGDGRGEFTMLAGSPFVTGKFPNIAAIGDVNGDGVADVAVSNPDGNSITLFTMSRRGSVASRKTKSVRGHPKGLAIRDVNDDGKAEIVVTSNTSNSVMVITGN